MKFIRHFADRIYHVHMKDAWWGHGDGTVGVFGGHTDFADPRRYWDFRSLGHGDIDFEEIIVALNDIGYTGPLSVEWEDSRMDREARRHRGGGVLPQHRLLDVRRSRSMRSLTGERRGRQKVERRKAKGWRGKAFRGDPDLRRCRASSSGPAYEMGLRGPVCGTGLQTISQRRRC